MLSMASRTLEWLSSPCEQNTTLSIEDIDGGAKLTNTEMERGRRVRRKLIRFLLLLRLRLRLLLSQAHLVPLTIREWYCQRLGASSEHLWGGVTS